MGQKSRSSLHAAVVILTCCLLAGCSGSSEQSKGKITPVTLDPKDPTTTTVAVTTTTLDMYGNKDFEVAFPEFGNDRVKAAWTGLIEAFNAYMHNATTDPNPDSQILNDYVISPHIDAWRKQLADMKAAGQVARFPENSQHYMRLEGVKLGETENQLILVTCSMDDSETVVTATGKSLNPGQLFLRSNDYMKLEGTRWKLEGRDGQEVTAVECPLHR